MSRHFSFSSSLRLSTRQGKPAAAGRYQLLLGTVVQMSRVLVVDDDPNTVRIVTVRLQSMGHKVIGTVSAQEALEAVATRGNPDVAVLDVSMPEMNGLELLQKLRAQEGLGDLPAIFLSARVLPEQVQAGVSSAPSI